MKTIAAQLQDAFRAAIQQAFGIDADPLIGLSQNEKFGDYQSNAAMGLSKQVGQQTAQKANPRQIAEQIKAKLDLGAIASEVSIAGPGFINVRLSPTWLAQQLHSVAKDQRLGIEPVQTPQTVVVEYSSPNIAKEMHVGHVRTTILGDAVARVLKFQGHYVILQNHIGDWGTQFGKVILAIWHICMAHHRGEKDYPAQIGKTLQENKNNPAERARLVHQIAARQQEDLNQDPDGTRLFAPFLEKYVPNLSELLPAYQFVTALEDTPEARQIQIVGRRSTSTLASLSKQVTSDLQKGDRTEPLNRQEMLAWTKVRQVTLDACQAIYDRLGVMLTLKDVRGESAYEEDLPKVVKELLDRCVAEESDGAIVVFVDGREQSPLIIEKSGGHGYLYGTTDLAAVRYRVEVLKAARVIYVVGAPQTQHLRQVFQTAKLAGWTRSTSFEHASFGSILGEDGKPMKTREGENVRLVDLLDEAVQRALQIVSEKNPELPPEHRRAVAQAVGIGAIKYADLSKDRNTDYIFSWEKMLAMEGNTGPYLQYAYARIRSIFRKSGEAASAAGNALKLESPFEISLAKHILRLAEVLEAVARDLKPHLLCAYLYELATRFSSFYENCPVIQSEEPTRSSRLALCDATARTLALGLDLLGIQHPEQM